MFCQHCQFENRQGVKFCEGCGLALESPCPACGHTGPAQRRFCGECGQQIAQDSTQPKQATPAHPTTPTEAYAGERRNLTVMLCDLVGSTLLAQQLDPEDLTNVIRHYTETTIEICRQYGGHVARFVGDGVLAYFGYPQAFENNAERSVRAGLDIVDAVRKIDIVPNTQLQCRVGIATGEVVTGETIESDFGAETIAIGKAPNLAARLQSLAEPDTVVVAHNVQLITDNEFEFIDLGQHTLKGFEEVQHVWHVTGRRDESKRSANGQSKSTRSALVARDEELATLWDCWQKTLGGHGQVAHLTGQPGIGKSRLVEEIMQNINGQECNTISLVCSSIETHSALHPLVSYVFRAAEFASGDNMEVRRDKLKSMLVNMQIEDEKIFEMFAQLVGISHFEIPGATELSPRQQKQRTLNAIQRWLKQLSRDKPVLLVVEDLHWGDPTTIAWLTEMIGAVENDRIFMLLASRSDFASPWEAHDHLTTIQLDNLSAQSAEHIVQNITGGKSFPREVMDLVLSRTDGVPLFVEAFTRAILDADTLRDAGNRYVMNGPLPTVGVPETLQDSLMSRLDRSPSVRNIAQVASVIGREFLLMLLEEIAEDQSGLNRALAELAEAQLAGPSSASGEKAWEFKHALVRDTAYKSLLRSRRRELHERVATALSTQITDLSEFRPELLAHHWSEASNPRESVPLWHRAGRRAAKIWANAEAVNHYRRALSDLQLTAEDDDRTQLELILLLELGDALRSAQGSSAADTNAAYRDAAKLCEKTGDITLLLRARYGEFVTNFMGARLDQAHAAAQALLTIGAENNHEACTIAGYQTAGMHAFATGKLEQAKQYFESALKGNESAFSSELDIQFPSLSQCYLSWTLHILGDTDNALSVSETSIERARLESPYSVALTLANACYLHQFRGDVDRIRALAKEVYHIAHEKALPAWEAVAEFFGSWAACQTEPIPENLDRLTTALELWTEDEIETPYFKCMVGESLLRAGRVEDGVNLINNAEELMQATGECWYQPNLEKVRAEFELTMNTIC